MSGDVVLNLAQGMAGLGQEFHNFHQHSEHLFVVGLFQAWFQYGLKTAEDIQHDGLQIGFVQPGGIS